jgi:hypothetical protein
MNTFGQMPALRHEYRFKSWLIALICFLALLIGGSGVMLLRQAQTQPRDAVSLILIALFPIAMGAYLLLRGFRSRIVLESTRIEVRGAFSEKSADQAEIEGSRTISSRNGSYTRLILKEGRGSITVSNSFNTDDYYREFFQKIPDLDERDRKALLDEISQQQDLGATPEERLDALNRAKLYGYGLTGVSILLAVALVLGKTLGPSTIQLCIVLLAIAPFVSAYLVWRSPLLYAVFKMKKDPRIEVSFIPFIAGIAFIFQNGGDHFVTMQPLYLTMAVAGVALLALFFNSAKSGASRAFIGLIVFVGFYSYGLAAVADTAFDSSPAVPYTSSVVGGHVSHGRSTSYYLRLAPWGPIDHEKDVSVSSHIYNNAHVGDTVCLALHSGSLHAPWFKVVPCGDDSAPANFSPPDLPQ